MDIREIYNKIDNWLIRHRLKRFTVLLIIILILFLIMDSIVMPLSVRLGHGKSVPDITGRPFAEAEKILADHSFRIILEGEKHDPHYPPGYVVYQNPKPSSIVKNGRRIYVMTSMGERLVQVPRLKGRSERDAKFIIQSSRLILEHISLEHSSYYPEGAVSEQSLQEGKEVKVGTPISIVVSLGRYPDRFLVPDLKGKDIEAAKTRLAKAGLTLGRISYKMESQLLPNTVLMQSIEPDQEVSIGTIIDLVVSQLPGQSIENSTDNENNNINE
ncbi:PASTA domain-containing protein [candidate division KSB1 bacterium]|nr:PASTA domain-containing protein [candidate division KSB1 bacterium]